jgi:D-alanine transaminase
MADLAYINDIFIPLEEARVSVNDRGYTFADGIYEVIATRNGQPFLLPEHFRRLERSAAGIGLRLPANYADWPKIIAGGIARAGFAETMIYIQLTRGVMPRRHVANDDLEPQLVMTFRPRPTFTAAQLAAGQRVITVEEIRWRRCWIKSTALLPNVIMKQKAARAGCDEAIFVDRDGEVHEGTAANVFFAAGGTLVTPPLGDYLLPGISRQYILDRAAATGLPVVVRRCTRDELLAADEVFLSSTTMDAMPVVEIDGHRIGDGRPGPLTRHVRELFSAQA